MKTFQKSKSFMTSVVFIFIILSSIYSVNNCTATPSFPTTQVKDEHGDIVTTGCRLNESFTPDISGITYASDGKILTSTIWLNTPLNKYIINPSLLVGKKAVTYKDYPNNTFVSLAQGKKNYVDSYLNDFNTSATILSHTKSHQGNNITEFYEYRIEKPLRFGFKIIYDINPLMKNIITYETDNYHTIVKVRDKGGANVTNPNILKDYVFLNHSKLASSKMVDTLEKSSLAMSSPFDFEKYKKHGVESKAVYNTEPIYLIVRTLISSKFSAVIYIQSVYEDTPDYLQAIQWDTKTKVWNETTAEISPDMTEMDTLKINKINSSKFFKTGVLPPYKGSIEINTNLSDINTKDSFLILYHVGNIFRANGSAFKPNNHKYNIVAGCSLDDWSNVVVAPPPKIQLSVEPNTLDLRSGQTKHFTVKVNSSSDLDSKVSFTVDNSRGLKSIITPVFVPTEISLPRHGIAVSDLQITGYSNDITTNTLPIIAHITLLANLSSKASTLHISNTNFTGLTLHAYPFVTVLPPKEPAEQISETFDMLSGGVQSLGTTITAIGAIAGGVVALLAYIQGKKKNKNRTSGESHSAV
jgi:hypothetical protein